MPNLQQRIVDRFHEWIVQRFHQLYYESHTTTWMNTHWLGYPAEKCPLDLWIYQEIIHEVRPDLIIETGTRAGGSALFLASMCDLVQHGGVVSIDIEDTVQRPKHDRIQYLLGSSTSDAIVERVAQLAIGPERIMAILDSDHSKEHVLKELTIYSRFVTAGSYLIAEDTNLNGNPVQGEFGPGPREAVDEFLASRSEFAPDLSREKFRFTFNPRGYLRKAGVGQVEGSGPKHGSAAE
jgi:cephalosporin hydroxylase